MPYELVVHTTRIKLHGRLLCHDDATPMVLCILLGILPADPLLAEGIQRDVTTSGSVATVKAAHAAAARAAEVDDNNDDDSIIFDDARTTMDRQNRRRGGGGGDDGCSSSGVSNAATTTTAVHWNSAKTGHALARDPDRDGSPWTLLMSATIIQTLEADGSEAPTTTAADTLVATVQEYLDRWWWSSSSSSSLIGDTSSPAVDAPSCELWATAPVPLPLKPLNGYAEHIDLDRLLLSTTTTTTASTTITTSNDAIDCARKTMQEWGLMVQRQVLLGSLNASHDDVVVDDENDQIHTKGGLEKFRTLVDERISEIERALAMYQPHLKVGVDDFQFREIASRNQERFDLRLQGLEVQELVQQHILDRPFGDNGGGKGGTTIRDFLQSVLVGGSATPTVIASSDDVFDVDVSVVYSRPGACEQGWHADGKHLPGAPDAGWDVPSNMDVNDDKEEGNLKKTSSITTTPTPSMMTTTTTTSTTFPGWKSRLATPYAICLFLPLIDLDESVGYTQFWPGSHRNREITGFGPVAQVTESVWNGNGSKAGDGVWYDYRLLHQGMPNVSETIVRPIVQIIFKQKWYVERDNYGSESVYGSDPNDCPG